jgi:hypothetical protein
VLLASAQQHGNKMVFKLFSKEKDKRRKQKKTRKKHEENDGSSVSVVKMGLMQHMKFALVIIRYACK